MENKLDLRIKKTYLALHNAFTSLLEEKKFEDFTVNELCDRAMIRRATFYKHFGDKYEYFTFYIREIAEEFRSNLSHEIISGDFSTYSVYMCTRLLTFIDDNEKIVNHILDSNMFHVLMELLEDLIERDSRLALQSTYPEMAPAEITIRASFYSGGIANSIRRQVVQHKKIDKDFFMKALSEII